VEGPFDGFNRSAAWKIDSFGFVPNDPTLAYFTGSGSGFNYSVYRYKRSSASQVQVTDLKLPGVSNASAQPQVAVLDDDGKVLCTSTGHFSADGGWTWVDKSASLRKAKLDYFRLVSATASEVLGYSSNTTAFSTSFALARSRNLGDSWDIIYRPDKQEEVLWIKSSDTLRGHLFSCKSRRLSSAKGTNSTLLVVLSESGDGGKSWLDLYSTPYDRKVHGSPGAVFRDAATVRTPSGRVIYVGGQVGLMKSSDEGKTWRQIGGIR
jgi:hypothetical protein